MIELKNTGVYLKNGTTIIPEESTAVQGLPGKRAARENTIAYSILRAHSVTEDRDNFNIRFDSLASHDITYVGIIQTARASGLKQFPVPYVMTNCHNSLCAVGGTINEDDHVFGLSAAKRYGGIFVPPNMAVLHSYIRETMTGCNRMILGSDSHTRYGALGCMGIGEGGPELVKQLLKNTYDIGAPDVVLVWLTGKPQKGVGPHDVALSLVKATFPNGFVKNKILEFAGPGISELSVDYRNGIDVMTTETTCLSSIWVTDDKVREYYEIHGRPEAYQPLSPGSTAYYDSLVTIELDKIKPMIALPFHPSNAWPISEFTDNAKEILASVEKDALQQFPSLKLDLAGKVNGRKVFIDQGIIGGCAGGTFENIMLVSSILKNASTGSGFFSLSIYPGSMPIQITLSKNGALNMLMEAGAIIKPAFCGPCFGAGDVPANNGLSIRHTTRNFPNREGSIPSDGQLAGVALMDALSIAATAQNAGILTSADTIDIPDDDFMYEYNNSAYEKRVYTGFRAPDNSLDLRFGPNIVDWPKMYELTENILLRLDSVIQDAVTTTDELIPSGETSSYRSNPVKLASFALSRRDPGYTGRAGKTASFEAERRAGNQPAAVMDVLAKVSGNPGSLLEATSVGSCVFARKPGDGSAREQAASCQKVLGGAANICYEYATKRYRSNCINWGLIPFTLENSTPFEYETGTWVYVPGIREAIRTAKENIPAKVIDGDKISDIILQCMNLTDEERAILLEGCLINHYAANAGS